MATWKLGSELRADVQAEALRRFVHRFTREHVPVWASGVSREKCPVQFDSDADWLAHTRFAVRTDGRLDERVRHCESSATWPDGEPTAASAWGEIGQPVG